MKKRLFLYVLTALVCFSACKKEEENNTPSGSSSNSKNAFSVASGKQVCLADGNLQYRATTATWRFAPKPWDAAKEDNLYASVTYDGWIDNFGWGTSGYMNQMPYISDGQNSNYYHDGDIANTEYDWGKHNAIQNGNATDPAGTWRCLSTDEWDYILTKRTASTVEGKENARYLMVTIGDQPGLMLFPDQFTVPEGIIFMSAASINEPGNYSYNQFSQADWDKFQKAGCVFMPASGCKLVSLDPQRMVSVDYLGCYWTSTYAGYGDMGHTGGQLLFSPYMAEMGSAGIQFSRSVRLAKDIK